MYTTTTRHHSEQNTLQTYQHKDQNEEQRAEDLEHGLAHWFMHPKRQHNSGVRGECTGGIAFVDLDAEALPSILTNLRWNAWEGDSESSEGLE